MTNFRNASTRTQPLRSFRCPKCSRITETLGVEAWCPGHPGGKPHVQPVKMRELKKEGA